MRQARQARIEYLSIMNELLSDQSVSTGMADPNPEGVKSTFSVHLSNFDGPFDLLLQLISKHKMDITEIALSVVTDDFIAFMRPAEGHTEGWDLEQTTEFLVVAATLLDLKAARLLPSGEIEDEGDLALLEARDLLFARLLQYRAFKEIASIFNEHIDSADKTFARLVAMEPYFAQLLPEVLIGVGPERFGAIAGRVLYPKAPLSLSIEHIHKPLVSVAEEAIKVVEMLRKNGRASFRSLIGDAESTFVVIARFLSLLELYREGALRFEQVVALGDLHITWVAGADSEIRVSDEFDAPVEEVQLETEGE